MEPEDMTELLKSHHTTSMDEDLTRFIMIFALLQ
jgi:hypothetical protein